MRHYTDGKKAEQLIGHIGFGGPVEFDASKRAMANLEKFNLLDNAERKGASKVLVAAALTYVAGLVTTLLEIVRLLLMVAGDRD